jgi:hypothetical protein
MAEQGKHKQDPTDDAAHIDSKDARRALEPVPTDASSNLPAEPGSFDIGAHEASDPTTPESDATEADVPGFDALVERLSARAAAAAPKPSGLAERFRTSLERGGTGARERTLRDLGLVGFGGKSLAGRIATQGLDGLSTTEKAVLGIGGFAEQSMTGLSARERALGALIAGGGGAEAMLAAQRDHDRKLAALGSFANRAAFTAWAEPRGGAAVARFAAFDAAEAFEASLKPLTGMPRDERWARAVLGGSLADLMQDRVPKGLLGEQTSAIARAAEHLVSGIGGRPGSLTRKLESLLRQGPALARTTRHLSLFAGALDVVGPGPASSAAFDALLGSWRTTSDLPASFWRNPEQRLERYRAADVDAGLLDADNAELVEMLVETGVVEGETRDGRTTALVEAGPVKVRVTAAHPRQAAMRILAAFELGLRGFVEARLRAAMLESGENPDKWFNQRMPGDVVKRARERREMAKADRELPAPPIAFVDLGDFIDIVTRRGNWPVFEPVFGSIEGFRVDIGRLNAIRRPLAHNRAIDPVQYTEATLIVARLTKAITLEGGWDQAWDDEP